MCEWTGYQFDAPVDIRYLWVLMSNTNINSTVYYNNCPAPRSNFIFHTL
jgi:hypothetical protein